MLNRAARSLRVLGTNNLAGPQKYAIKVATVYIVEVAVKPQIHAACNSCNDRENDTRQQNPQQCALLLTTTE